MKFACLAVALVAMLTSPLDGADLRGIYLYTEHPENSANMQQFLQALQVSGVDGATLLIGWKLIEPDKGSYAWNRGSGVNLLDQLVDAANAANKKIGLAIRAGQDTPDWLFTEGAPPLQFSVAPLEGDAPSGSCNPVKIAAPWDPVFLAEWDSMLVAVAQHLKDTGRYAAIGSVRLTGINRTTAELRIPAEILTSPCVTNSVQTWLQAGYRPSKLLQAWDAITNSFLKSFPDKAFTLPVIPSASGNGNREYPFPPIDGNGCPYQPPWPGGVAASCGPDSSSFPNQFPPDPDQNAPLLQLASSKFAGRLTVAYQNLDLRYPAEPYIVYAAQTWGTMPAFQTNDYIGFQQAACSVVSGNFGPCDSSSYYALIEIGIHPGGGLQSQYIEVLPPDAIAFPSAILKAHAELTANLRRRAVSH